MIDLQGTPAGDALERRFALIGDERERERLRHLFLGATEVQHTLVLPRPGIGGSHEQPGITLVANIGVTGDVRACGLTHIELDNEPVLSRILGMSGSQAINRNQVILVDRAEGGRLATRLGISSVTVGAQGENIVLSNFTNPRLNVGGVSALPAGTVITFMRPDGAMSKASLHVVNRAPAYRFGHMTFIGHAGHDLAMPYENAVTGVSGVAAMVKTSGDVQAGDIALVWRHA